MLYNLDHHIVDTYHHQLCSTAFLCCQYLLHVLLVYWNCLVVVTCVIDCISSFDFSLPLLFLFSPMLLLILWDLSLSQSTQKVRDTSADCLIGHWGGKRDCFEHILPLAFLFPFLCSLFVLFHSSLRLLHAPLETLPGL